MADDSLIRKITQKKEFAELPKKDVKMAFANFDNEKYLDEEKIKLTRNLLRKVFSAFTSQKLLKIKDKSAEWILKKHLSTRERFVYYEEIYNRILKDFSKKITIIDLGAGVNGLSYKYLQKITKNFDYIGIEAVGQLVTLMNHYFKTRGIKNCKAIHLSLFELEKLKKYFKQIKGKKVVFLFKTIDSLEMLKRDYSKKLLEEVVPLVDRVVVSFATRSMIKKTRFKVKRKWILKFIEDKFKIMDDFEIGGERYIIFCKNKKHL